MVSLEWCWQWAHLNRFLHIRDQRRAAPQQLLLPIDQPVTWKGANFLAVICVCLNGVFFVFLFCSLCSTDAVVCKQNSDADVEVTDFVKSNNINCFYTVFIVCLVQLC